MDKTTVIQYLNQQLAKIEQQDFDLAIWKESTASFLERAMGVENYFSKQIRSIELEITVSIEELYPKKIPDIKKTKSRLRALTQDLIDQIGLMDDTAFNIQHKGEETLAIVVESLKNRFTGNQLKALEELASGSKQGDNIQTVLDLIKQYEVNTIQHIVAEILESKEIWKEIKS